MKKQVISTKIHQVWSVTQGIICGNVNLRFFTLNYTMSCSFSL